LINLWGSDDYEGGPGCDDCSSECPEGAFTDCVNDRCVCGEVPDTGPQYGPGEGPGEPGDYDNNGEPPSSEGEEETEEVEPESDGGDDSGDDNSEGDSEITGNAFLDYYWS